MQKLNGHRTVVKLHFLASIESDVFVYNENKLETAQTGHSFFHFNYL